MLLVGGEVDIDTAPLLESALVDELDRHSRVCCDLAGVTFFGAAGAHALLTAHQHADELGRTLLLRGARGMTAKVLRIVGLSDNPDPFD